MIKSFTKFIDALTPWQWRLFWGALILVILVAIFRFIINIAWFIIVIVVVIFIAKELFQYGRRKGKSL